MKNKTVILSSGVVENPDLSFGKDDFIKATKEMKKDKIFSLIRQWGIEKGIIEKSNTLKQLAKLDEERLELFNALLDNNQDEVMDAIGDCVVVLTLLAEMRNLKIEDCISSAYDVINQRTGKMQNGIFVKDK